MSFLRVRRAGVLRTLFGQPFARIREINEKYRTPQMKVTPMVKFALLFLRLYLLLLVGLLIFKFVTIVAGS